MVRTLSDSDVEALKSAKQLLENPGFLIRTLNLFGRPIEYVIQSLPAKNTEMIQKYSRAAIEKALDVAVASMRSGTARKRSSLVYNGAASALGAAGGMFGFVGLAVELPVTTTVILRAIAEIAKSEGEDLTDPNVRMQCLQVFALGGEAKSDDAADVGYFAVRAALAKAASEASQYIGARAAARETAPAFVRFITQIASRYGIAVSEKAMAQAVPVLGAVGGATINAVFMNYFQDVARAHFTIRRLERIYGEQTVRECYDRLLISPETGEQAQSATPEEAEGKGQGEERVPPAPAPRVLLDQEEPPVILVPPPPEQPSAPSALKRHLLWVVIIGIVLIGCMVLWLLMGQTTR